MKNGIIALIPLLLAIAAFFTLGFSIREDGVLFFSAIALYTIVATIYATRPMSRVATDIDKFLMDKA